MYRNIWGVTVLICIVPLRCLFYFLSLFTLGGQWKWVGVGRLIRRNVWGTVLRVGGWGVVVYNTKCHNARTSSIYCFRDCLLYPVCCPFLNFFFFLIHCTNILFLNVSNLYIYIYKWSIFTRRFWSWIVLTFVSFAEDQSFTNTA